MTETNRTEPSDRSDPPRKIPRYPEIVDGPDYRYVAQQLLVNAFDVDMVVEEMARMGGEPDRDTAERLDGLTVGFLMPEDVDIPTLVTRLRAAPRDVQPRVGPNHVFAGAYVPMPNVHGGPFGDPAPAPDPTITSSGAQSVLVAVLDTGLLADAVQRHRQLGGHIQPGEADAVYSPGPPTIAKDCGGHGEFVAGVIAQVAPDARILPIQVLEPTGDGTDVSVADGILRASQAGAQVINMSLSGYTAGDQPPTALESVLAPLAQSISVVAAAGNGASTRRAWPAAFPRVVGVAALDTTQPVPVLASFTNRGSWVDCCARGVGVRSTWVSGQWATASATVTFAQGARWSGTSFAAPQVAAEIVNTMLGQSLDARHAELAVLMAGKPVWNIPGIGAGLGVAVLPAVDVVS